jgi:hypothetical protein
VAEVKKLYAFFCRHSEVSKRVLRVQKAPLLKGVKSVFTFLGSFIILVSQETWFCGVRKLSFLVGFLDTF